jgi:NAD(P)H-hydrate repair Nnr-like enzyme with NAD(P)H-hydrate epimerase domain
MDKLLELTRQEMVVTNKPPPEAKNPSPEVKDPSSEFEQPDLILDALIGYGLTGNPRSRTAERIDWMNHSGGNVI